MDIAWTTAKEGICAPTRAPGLVFSVCRGCGKTVITVYGSPDVTGGGKQCREHRSEVLVCRSPYVVAAGRRRIGHHMS